MLHKNQLLRRLMLLFQLSLRIRHVAAGWNGTQSA